MTEEEKGQEKQKESVAKVVSTYVKSQEVKLLVSPPKPACGNSLRENIQDFESLCETIRLTRFWSTARIPKITWLTFEQFKGPLVEYQLTLS